MTDATTPPPAAAPIAPAASAPPTPPAASPPNAPPAAPPAEAPPAATPPKDGAPPPAEPKPGEVKPPDAPPEPPKPDDKDLLFDDGKPKDGEEGKPEDKKDGEGEQAVLKIEDITVPEEMTISETMKAPILDLATKHKFTKEVTQEIVDLGVKMRQQDITDWQATKAGWRKEIVDDPELGGTKLEATKLSANKVIEKFSSSPEHKEELRQDLILLGLGNKRSFVRLLNNIAKATGNDTTLTDGQSGKGAGDTNSMEAKAKRMYPGMN